MNPQLATSLLDQCAGCLDRSGLSRVHRTGTLISGSFHSKSPRTRGDMVIFSHGIVFGLRVRPPRLEA
jgi:hypothetical protein